MKNKIQKTKGFSTDFDTEEKELLVSIEHNKWKSVVNLEEEMMFAKEAAANALCKDARINIRVSSVDLDHLKQRAAYEGMPYQTLIASVLHKYAAGHIA